MVRGLLAVTLFLPFVFVVVRCSPVCLFHGRLGAWLLCGVCAPRFVEGSFGLGLCRVPRIDDIGGGNRTGPWVVCSSRSWGSFCIRESLWRFGQPSSASELSNSDPQC